MVLFNERITTTVLQINFLYPGPVPALFMAGTWQYLTKSSTYERIITWKLEIALY
jgi:hypothetical protein